MVLQMRAWACRPLTCAIKSTGFEDPRRSVAASQHLWCLAQTFHSNISRHNGADCSGFITTSVYTCPPPAPRPLCTRGHDATRVLIELHPETILVQPASNRGPATNLAIPSQSRSTLRPASQHTQSCTAAGADCTAATGPSWPSLVHDTPVQLQQEVTIAKLALRPVLHKHGQHVSLHRGALAHSVSQRKAAGV